ncbi:MAG: hypothetical protein IJ600_08480 [Lachnospiraceae bacterium]|nr:hypothetical protein [Lachnospiraceae bacterium]
MKKSLKNNVCLIIIVICCLALEIYGILLSQRGYVPPQEGVGAEVALALLSIREGVFPWNMETNEMMPADTVPEDPAVASEPAVSLDGAAETAMEEGTDQPAETQTALSEPEPAKPEVQTEPEETWPPAFIEVTDEYFTDAVFIGDSRIVGVYEYAGIPDTTFYAKTSMTIYKMMNSRVETTKEVKTVREGLEKNQFRKVYLMVGLNEIGIGDTEYFIDQYREVVEEIQSLQPDAMIFIQGIMHVSGRLDKKDTVYNNTAINARNAGLQALAEEMHAVYLDVNEAYDDEDGNLPGAFTGDDVHLKANHYDLWHDYYLTHAVELPPIEAEGNGEEAEDEEIPEEEIRAGEKPEEGINTEEAGSKEEGSEETVSGVSGTEEIVPEETEAEEINFEETAGEIRENE